MAGNPWIYSPHQFYQDLAITKSIPIRERLRFTWQTEFLNVWNHPVWGTPNLNINSSSFGHANVIRSTALGVTERQIEFRANIEF
jgi:hypothetical protein